MIGHHRSTLLLLSTHISLTPQTRPVRLAALTQPHTLTHTVIVHIDQC